jgi:hypothetical protein
MPSNTTLMLYFRQILIMLVSLYTMRVGCWRRWARIYWIDNVVGGFVSL